MDKMSIQYLIDINRINCEGQNSPLKGSRACTNEIQKKKEKKIKLYT